MGISQCNKVKGECLSFLPNYIFGICSTCQHNNMFMKKEAAEGRIPRNFNPETMQAIGADEETVSAEAWTEIERMQQETKKLVEKTNQYVSEPEQLSLFD